MRPKAFRIFDFRAIRDSHECPFSADDITVIAGQNESGKTSVLCALRDFDLPEGAEPVTPEYQPEGRWDAKPRVSVLFEVDVDSLEQWLAKDGFWIPEAAFDKLSQDGEIWITRDLNRKVFELPENYVELWPEPDSVPDTSADILEDENEGSLEAGLTSNISLLSPTELCGFLYSYWPDFVYFDSFEDRLPRDISVSSLLQDNKKDVPQSVRDFIALSGMDPDKLNTLFSQDKLLGNYLDSCSTTISGDFLTFWKTKDGRSTQVTLRVKHLRDESGDPRIAFYVRDQVDQYPEQRSKGFLWFLSFYLRLAAAHKHNPDRSRFLLIDEPGSYLHARAQQDVLELLERRLTETNYVLYSTHSQYLLPIDNLHRLRIAIRFEGEGTVVLDRLTHPLLRGEAFTDTLSPLINAIGMDVRKALNLTREYNVLVEGISDFFYITAWARSYEPSLLETTSIFPGQGTGSSASLVSLFIGWGLEFAVLLDRDKSGQEAGQRLQKYFAVPETRILFPRSAVTTEDILSDENFRTLIAALDPSFNLLQDERPSGAIRRQKIDKVLLARKFSELTSTGTFVCDKKTEANAKRLLSDILRSFSKS
jgi:hypothetical protein